MIENIIQQLAVATDKNTSTIQSMSEELVLQNELNFSVLEDVMIDIRSTLNSILNIDSERFEYEKEQQVKAGLKSPSAGLLLPEDIDKEKLLNILNKSVKEEDIEKGFLSGMLGGGLAVLIGRGLIGIINKSIPLLLLGAGAYIRERADNFDWKKELDGKVIAGATGAGIGAALGFFIGGPLGSAIGGGLGTLAGLIIDEKLLTPEQKQSIEDNLTLLTTNLESLYNNISNTISDILGPVKDALDFVIKEFDIDKRVDNLLNSALEFLGLDEKGIAEGQLKFQNLQLRNAREAVENIENQLKYAVENNKDPETISSLERSLAKAQLKLENTTKAQQKAFEDLSRLRQEDPSSEGTVTGSSFAISDRDFTIEDQSTKDSPVGFIEQMIEDAKRQVKLEQLEPFGGYEPPKIEPIVEIQNSVPQIKGIDNPNKQLFNLDTGIRGDEMNERQRAIPEINYEYDGESKPLRVIIRNPGLVNNQLNEEALDRSIQSLIESMRSTGSNVYVEGSRGGDSYNSTSIISAKMSESKTDHAIRSVSAAFMA